MKTDVVTANRPQLSLSLGCNSTNQTILQQRYMAYPLSVSPLFRREDSAADGTPSKRAYLYRMNTSPGLLAGDALKVFIRLDEESQLYLADQSALKVHQMPEKGACSTVRYDIEMGESAMLEFLPEPLILFEDAALEQTTEILLHKEAGVCWGEIVLPGRLARGEKYQFRRYLNKTLVRSLDGELWFAETMNLVGKGNSLVDSPLFAGAAVLGTLILIFPRAILTAQVLKTLGDRIDEMNTSSLNIASSVLPSDRGLFVRAMSETTREMMACFKDILNCGRSLQGQNLLPYGL